MKLQSARRALGGLCAGLVDAAVKRYSRLDIAFNNAGTLGGFVTGTASLVDGGVSITRT